VNKKLFIPYSKKSTMDFEIVLKFLDIFKFLADHCLTKQTTTPSEAVPSKAPANSSLNKYSWGKSNT
jgi:hypothetical protein